MKRLSRLERSDRVQRAPVLLYGRNAVLEAVRAGRRVTRILLDEGASSQDERVRELLALCEGRSVALKRAPRRELDRMTSGAQHQGVVALVAAPAAATLNGVLDRCEQAGKAPCIVLLREVAHAQNLGAILRTAEAAGVDAVIVPTRDFPTLGDAARIAMGAAEYVPVIGHSLTQAAAVLRRKGIRLIGADAAAQRSYWDCDLTGPLGLVLGGEHAGLRGPLAKACDELVRIPMTGRISSLNVSVACALLLYERLRQTSRGARP